MFIPPKSPYTYSGLLVVIYNYFFPGGIIQECVWLVGLHISYTVNILLMLINDDTLLINFD